MSEKVFALYHIYDRIIDNVIDRKIKRIGFFETYQKCIDTVKLFKNFPGFKDYPEICFKIFEYEIGQEYWRDEFLSLVNNGYSTQGDFQKPSELIILKT